MAARGQELILSGSTLSGQIEGTKEKREPTGYP